MKINCATRYELPLPYHEGLSELLYLKEEESYETKKMSGRKI